MLMRQTLTLVLLAFVLHDIVKIWAEHKTWNQNFKQSQSKNDKKCHKQ